METITWQAYEFEKREKPVAWYIALWIIAAGLAVVSFIFGSILMLVLVIVAALVMSLYAAKEPRKITFQLDEKSLTIGSKRYSLDGFDSFWIFPKERYNVLSLNPDQLTRPNIKIVLPFEQTEAVRNIMAGKVEEKEHTESLIEALVDWLGF